MLSGADAVLCGKPHRGWKHPDSGTGWSRRAALGGAKRYWHSGFATPSLLAMPNIARGAALSLQEATRLRMTVLRVDT